jgi:hypothetical protein
VIQQHLDRDLFHRIAIGHVKVGQVSLHGGREVNTPFIDQLHHQCRVQHFRDRADRHQRLRNHCHSRRHIGHAGGGDLPLAGPKHGRTRARHVVLLDRPDEPGVEMFSGRPARR